MVNARRSEQRSARMHKTGAIALLTLSLTGTAWGILMGGRFIGQQLFSHNDRFTIRRLEIDARGKLQPAHVKEYAGVDEGMNLFEVNLDEIRESLESVPVVSSVQVRRKLPDTLQIEVKERVALACFGEESVGYPLAVDREGFILGPTSVAPHLPIIVGLREKGLRPGSQVSDQYVQTALHVLELCEAPAISRFVRIKSVDIGNPEYLDIKLIRGESIALSLKRLETKLDKLCEIMKHAADMGKAVASVDMTVEKNFPVKYQ